jgi:hypothetical protein
VRGNMWLIGKFESESLAGSVFVGFLAILCGAIAWNCAEYVFSHLLIRWER